MLALISQILPFSAIFSSPVLKSNLHFSLRLLLLAEAPQRLRPHCPGCFIDCKCRPTSQPSLGVFHLLYAPTNNTPTPTSPPLLNNTESVEEGFPGSSHERRLSPVYFPSGRHEGLEWLTLYEHCQHGREQEEHTTTEVLPRVWRPGSPLPNHNTDPGRSPTTPPPLPPSQFQPQPPPRNPAHRSGPLSPIHIHTPTPRPRPDMMPQQHWQQSQTSSKNHLPSQLSANAQYGEKP